MNWIVRNYRDAYTGIPAKVWMLSGIMLVNRTGSMVTMLLNLFLVQEKGLLPQEAAWVFGAYGLGGMAGSALGGRLTDRFGPFKVQLWSLSASALGFWAVFELTGFWPLILGAFMLALTTDSYRPANMTAIAFFAKPEEKAKSFSLNRLSMNLGFAVGSIVAGALLGYGYGWVFFMNGLTCLLAALLLFFLFAEKHTPSPQKTASETATANPLADRLFVFFSFMGFLLVLTFAQIMFVLPSLLKRSYGVPEDEVMRFLGINGLLIALFEIVLVNKLHKHLMKSIIVGTLLVGAGLFISSFSHKNLLFLPLGVIVITFGEMLSFALMSLFVEQRSGPANKGSYMGYHAMAFAVAIACTPSWGFWLADHLGFEKALWAASAVSLPAAAGFVYIYRKTVKKKVV